jgi:hypothetical protein
VNAVDPLGLQGEEEMKERPTDIEAPRYAGVMSATGGDPFHGTIEAENKSGRVLRQLAAIRDPLKGRRGTDLPLFGGRKDPAARWGAVHIDWGKWHDGFSAEVSAGTDFSKAPVGSVVLKVSAYVTGNVTVEGCCTSGNVIVGWHLTAMVAPGGKMQSWARIGATKASVKPTQKVHAGGRRKDFDTAAGAFVLDIRSGRAKFYTSVVTTWHDYGLPKPVKRLGHASVHTLFRCQ